jgi:formate dehydrogenase major subunit
VKKALESLGFLVVQEIFMSETAKFANVVLPGASFFEKSGIFTNGGRRVQRVNEVIPPLAGTKTDGQIVVDIECDFPALEPCEWRMLRFTAQ